MISQLSGTILQKNEEEGFIVLDVQGVGYKVAASETVLSRLPQIGESAALHTHLHIRENAQELYGFMSLDELEMFELLISISGVGPKAGLGILSQATPNEIQHAITAGNTAILTRVSGVGKKTAERVVLELKNKIKEFQITDVTGKRDILEPAKEAMDALVALGCSESEAKEALSSVSVDVTKVEEQVKEALKILGGGK
ncbi:Holliday junction branch migration protein RuvA [Patescibacteria group bacterium]